MRKSVFLWILSIVMAFSLWYMQRLVRVQKVSAQVPVNIVNLPDSLLVLGKSSEYLNYVATGRGIAIVLMNFIGPKVNIDASKFMYGSNYIDPNTDIDDTELRLPDWLKVSLTPVIDQEETVVDVDRKLTQVKRIELVFANQDAQQAYTTQKWRLNAENLNVSGPEQILAKMSTIKTDSLTVAGLNRPNPVLDLNFWHPAIQPQQNYVRLVKQELDYATKAIPFINIRVPKVYNGDNLKLVPPRVSAKIKGKKQDLAKLDQSYIKAWLVYNPDSLSNVGKIRFELPQMYELIEYTPKTIKVMTDE